ncbi:PREDICTED: uncharacterized protein LOC108533202 [Rhinopithecus bieti]|uniref:uncharacterized protein LOC108533202 n=1 Tax=Rhinopithecus bieti TaxID=61621 RepID=UPI00083BE1D7|nr:PREDICTED: uncharacterized protein LOC108533202 [Rhinopithecus bieti]
MKTIQRILALLLEEFCDSGPVGLLLRVSLCGMSTGRRELGQWRGVHGPAPRTFQRLPQEDRLAVAEAPSVAAFAVGSFGCPGGPTLITHKAFSVWPWPGVGGCECSCRSQSAEGTSHIQRTRRPITEALHTNGSEEDGNIVSKTEIGEKGKCYEIISLCSQEESRQKQRALHLRCTHVWVCPCGVPTLLHRKPLWVPMAVDMFGKLVRIETLCWRKITHEPQGRQ